MPEALGILVQKVPRSEPGIPLLEDIPKNLLLRSFRVRVPIKPLGRMVLSDWEQQFTGFIHRCLHAKAIGSTDRRFGFHVELHNFEASDQVEAETASSNSAPLLQVRLPADIHQGSIAFCGSIELHHHRDVELILKLVPHLRPQAVANGPTQLVRDLTDFWMIPGIVHQISAQLTDVLKRRALLFRDFSPKARSAELLRQSHRGTRHKAGHGS
mmetsp:Transcript_70438/g.111299  ORF Transcript_70438/g.111299 Transcript_70438/m.111299 type:complete len:213 (-) Transcript_70438:44-682(-)